MCGHTATCSMLIKAPPFYPEEFKAAADALLVELYTSQQDITVSTAKTFYLHFCSEFSFLLKFAVLYQYLDTCCGQVGSNQNTIIVVG